MTRSAQPKNCSIKRMQLFCVELLAPGPVTREIGEQHCDLTRSPIGSAGAGDAAGEFF
jgi:hypothetical protein